MTIVNVSQGGRSVQCSTCIDLVPFDWCNSCYSGCSDSNTVSLDGGDCGSDIVGLRGRECVGRSDEVGLNSSQRLSISRSHIHLFSGCR